MWKRIGPVALILAFALSATALAHGGHKHAMGTVVAVDTRHVELKTTEGKTVSIELTPETKYFKNKAAAAASDLTVGSRVMVDWRKGEKDQMIAREVQIGVAPAGSGAKP